MLVALPSSIAFGILVYSGLGAGYVSMGAMAGMLGAAALGVVASLVGQTGGLISAPCAPAAAVLSALLVELLAGHGLAARHIIALLVLTALLAAGLQLLYGVIGGGRLIKFIPYPVVTGYLSGVGLLIALGQLPKFLGFPHHFSLLPGIGVTRVLGLALPARRAGHHGADARRPAHYPQAARAYFWLVGRHLHVFRAGNLFPRLAAAQRQCAADRTDPHVRLAFDRHRRSRARAGDDFAGRYQADSALRADALRAAFDRYAEKLRGVGSADAEPA